MTTTITQVRLKQGEQHNLLRLTEVDEAPHRRPSFQELKLSGSAFNPTKWVWWILLTLLFTLGIPMLVGMLWQTEGRMRLFWNTWFVVAGTLIVTIALILIFGSIRQAQQTGALRRSLTQLDQARHEIGEVIESRINPGMRHLHTGRFLLTVRIGGYEHRIAQLAGRGHFTTDALPEVGDLVDAWVLPNGPVIVQAQRAVLRKPWGRPVVDMPARDVQQAAARVTSPVREHPLDRIRLVAPPESADRLARTWAAWNHARANPRDWWFALIAFVLVALPAVVGIPAGAWQEPRREWDQTIADVWLWNTFWVAFPWFFVMPLLILFVKSQLDGAGRTALHRVYPTEPATVPNTTGWIVRQKSNIDNEDGVGSVRQVRVLTEDGQLIEFAKVNGQPSVAIAALPVIGGGVRIWQLSDGRLLAQTALRGTGA